MNNYNQYLINQIEANIDATELEIQMLEDMQYQYGRSQSFSHLASLEIHSQQIFESLSPQAQQQMLRLQRLEAQAYASGHQSGFQ